MKQDLTTNELTAIILAASQASSKDAALQRGLAKLNLLAEEFIINLDSNTKPYTFTITPHTIQRRFYTYYRVTKETKVYPKNALLTRNEFHKDVRVQAEKVRVPNDTCYYSFGMRFSTIYDDDNE